MRLAFVEAGGDWRSLSRLRVRDGVLADYAILPGTVWRRGVHGVCAWNDPTGTVAGKSLPTNGQFSVADPRHVGPPKYSNVYRVVPWSAAGPAVTSSKDGAVADPRPAEAMLHNAYRTVGWTDASRAITGQHAPSNGAMCVADPRPSLDRRKGDAWVGAGHYGVVPWDAHAGAVSASAGCDNGRWSVADPRALPAPDERTVAVIRALDGTWHRPFTTLELAALQSLVDPEEQLELDGLSDQGWRERIGNAVPPDAAQAIAETMGRTLLLAWSGEGFRLSSVPIWVRPVAVALSLRTPEDAAP